MKIGFGPALASKLTSQVAMISIFATATVGGVSLISSSVFASLDATATYSPQSIDSGTLTLTKGPDATFTAELTTPIAKLAPNDIVHRYVKVTNTGNLAGAALYLKATPSAASILDSDLTVTAQACSAPWVIDITTPNPNDTTCPGVASTSATGSLSTFGTAQSLATSLGVSGIAYVKVTVSLANIIESSNNGTILAAADTFIHEGISSSVTWQFSEAQRNSTETNS